jgi:N-acyl-D-amino-acid deacylase
VKDGVIHRVTKSDIRGAEEIDARGSCVAPGFIDFHSHVNGRLFSAECLARQGATTTIGGERYFDAGIIRDIETGGFLINHGFYISYSFTLRKAVGLHDPAARADSGQISHMLRLTERFLDFGVLGIHLGLEYVPGTTYEEVESLLALSKKYGRIAMVHLRKDGYDAMESVEEIIRCAESTGAAVNILHVMYTAGLRGLLDRFLDRVRAAREKGCDITADTGVYAAYPTFAGSLSLGAGWAEGYKNGVNETNLMLSSGVRVGDFCDESTFRRIRREFPATLITAFVYDEDQIAAAMLPDFMMISTNAAYGPHSDNIGHPEGAGTFPKLLGEYVRDKKTLGLVEAVKKITYAPAARIGLVRKGSLEPGRDADITIFNPDTVKAFSDYVGRGDPNAAPAGIDHVIVGGKPVLAHGRFLPLSRYPGRLVKYGAAGEQKN